MVGTNKWTDEQIAVCFSMHKDGFRKWEIAEHINKEWPRRGATSAGVTYVLNNKKNQVAHSTSKHVQIKTAARIATKLNVQLPQVVLPSPPKYTNPLYPGWDATRIHLFQKQLLSSAVNAMDNWTDEEIQFHCAPAPVPEPEIPASITQTEPAIEKEDTTEAVKEPEFDLSAIWAEAEAAEAERWEEINQWMNAEVPSFY